MIFLGRNFYILQLCHIVLLFCYQNLKHYLFAGFVPQAGVSIGLALLLVNGFPQYKIIGELIIASAVFNEIIGPFIFKFAINQYNNEVN